MTPVAVAQDTTTEPDGNVQEGDRKIF